MKNQFPNLITPNAQAGLALASQLAAELHAQLGASQVDLPGGMNYRVPPAFPPEMTGSILFYAIAAANHGWSGNFRADVAPELSKTAVA